MTSIFRHLRLAVPLAFAAAVAACASNPELDPSAVQRAETSIQDAKDVNAQEYAADTLARAEDRLAMARDAIKDGKNERAHYLVDEAAVLAELAQSQALQRDSQQALAQVQKNLQALKQRLQ